MVPHDMEQAERFTPNFFAQARSICKAQTRFRNAGYTRKLDKKKVRACDALDGAGIVVALWRGVSLGKRSHTKAKFCLHFQHGC